MVDLVEKLHKNGSWCGETHLEKVIFILQDLSKPSLGYKFILYKHGPFSFDLKDELAAMRSANVLEFMILRDGYGPSMVATEFGRRILQVNRENVETYLPINDFLSEWFASKDVKQLEKIATAYYVTQKHPRDPILARARKVNSLKPHVDVDAAEEALLAVEEKRKQAKMQLVTANS